MEHGPPPIIQLLQLHGGREQIGAEGTLPHRGGVLHGVQPGDVGAAADTRLRVGAAAAGRQGQEYDRKGDVPHGARTLCIPRVTPTPARRKNAHTSTPTDSQLE
ncbi:Hypothetical protein AA314_00517 [Archangium gephyra]|uniref:Uncharacterized protein n=1 Tax=Archangium gephyra TaxID=48 RepID=A0AAC8TBY2_9BACT|nr:Hypothetical protein AA314_00517 [Archangium gephyra]